MTDCRKQNTSPTRDRAIAAGLAINRATDAGLRSIHYCETHAGWHVSRKPSSGHGYSVALPHLRKPNASFASR